MSYRIHDVPVRGGTLRMGDWGDPDAPLVLAVHGITASHRAWLTLAGLLGELRIVAPDLRGRGRSNGLPGPYGMAQHADDLADVLAYLGAPPVVLVGHSMGAFVSVVAANRHPALFSELVLVDGGLTLLEPRGTTRGEGIQAALGPAIARLSMTFANRAAYRDFWRDHPAFRGHWSARLEDYLDYDLDGEEPQLHPSTRGEAVVADSPELTGSPDVDEALHELPPARLLWAPRGLLDRAPGLYATRDIERWSKALPQLTVTKVPDVNHYTIVMEEPGASVVAAAVREAVAR